VNEQKTGGKVTYGSVLATHFGKKFNGVDVSKDWHQVVTGESRYDLLRQTVEELGPIV